VAGVPESQLTVGELARLLQEAQDAHREYERTTGERDENWPEWYAQYIVDQLSRRSGEAAT